MLEQYFVKPATIDRIRGSWMAGEIETYLAWLAAQGYSTKSIWRRIPITFAFGEFARERGATIIGDCRRTSRRSGRTASRVTIHAPA
jgi:integrase/recombinase XerD